MLQVAKIIDQKTHSVPGKLLVTEHLFDVPLDYTNVDSRRMRVFARSACMARDPLQLLSESNAKPKPWLVYLQGGPGFGCRQPQEHPWTSIVLQKGYQVLFLDQRGTGMSTPFTASFPDTSGDASRQAAYLTYLRADNIVRDCEAIRHALTMNWNSDFQKWSIFGQSFGGFVCTTYLSLFPEGLREVFVSGGLPPLVPHPGEVYKRLYRKVIERNSAYYEKYPEDDDRIKRIVSQIHEAGNDEIALPSGGWLSVRRFQQLGIHLGFHGGIDKLHDLVLRAWMDLQSSAQLTRPTLSALESATSFDDNVLYAVLHEAAYCQNACSNWSAEEALKEYPEFDSTTKSAIFFTGEMIYRWQFDCSTELKRLRKVADMIAAKDDWPQLYDEAQLARNEVPVYAAAYVDDMYVDFEFSMETARKIKGCKVHITNAFYHDAIRSRAGETMKALFNLRDDCID